MPDSRTTAIVLLLWVAASLPLALAVGRVLRRNAWRYPPPAGIPRQRSAARGDLRGPLVQEPTSGPGRQGRYSGRRLVVVVGGAALLTATGASAAAAFGGLPRPAQRAAHAVIEAMTPFTVPEPAREDQRGPGLVQDEASLGDVGAPPPAAPRTPAPSDPPGAPAPPSTAPADGPEPAPSASVPATPSPSPLPEQSSPSGRPSSTPAAPTSPGAGPSTEVPESPQASSPPPREQPSPAPTPSPSEEPTPTPTPTQEPTGEVPDPGGNDDQDDPGAGADPAASTGVPGAPADASSDEPGPLVEPVLP